MREILIATDEGLGNGETPIFPIQIFILKDGINYNPGDPNYDLFKLAMKVSAKRLFPNFVSADASFNLPYYKEGDYRTFPATMGCADGDELVVYRYKESYYCESIKRLWDRIVNDGYSINKMNISKYITPIDLDVWDGDKKFVNVKTLIKNPDMSNWTRIRFSNGRSVLVTADHPFYTENRGRVFTKELEIGDTIKTEYGLPIPLNNDENVSDRSIKLAYILGLIITDGCYSNGVISVTLNAKTETDIAKKFIDSVSYVWGRECKIRHWIRGEKGNYIEISIKGKNKNIIEFLKLSFNGSNKMDRSIPSIIFNSPRKIRLSFLAGMIDGDGHVSYKAKVQIGSTNKELSFQQMALAQSLGFPSKMYLNHYSKKKPDKIRYRIEFSMSDDIAEFMGSCKKISYQWNGTVSVTKTPKNIRVESIEYLGFLNKESYDLETISDHFTLSFINSGNCRTRVLGNVNGPEHSASRGNFAFVTINLPKLAIESKGSIDKFFELFDKYIQVSHDYLLFRYDFIKKKKVYNFPFLMGQGVWMDSYKLTKNDSIEEVLKHSTLSIGFCGLAECLIALTGKHHGESQEAQELGLKIIGHLREMTDKYTKEEHINWSTFASPAESTSGSMQRSNRKKYGIIPGVTDRGYMTNSNHVPPYYKIRAIDKIKIEAPYHRICNAGDITYIEYDGDPLKNLDAFEKLVRAMHDNDMGYFSINHAIDRDPVCGYTGIIENECPHCHRTESIKGLKITLPKRLR